MDNDNVMYFVFICVGLIAVYFLIKVIVGTVKKRSLESDGKIINIYMPNNPVEAEAIKALLDEKNIYCVIHSFHDSAYNGIWQAQTGWGVVRIYEKDKIQAEELIADFLGAKQNHEIAIQESKPEESSQAYPKNQTYFPKVMLVIGAVLILLTGIFVVNKIIKSSHKTAARDFFNRGYDAGIEKRYEDSIKYYTMAIDAGDDHQVVYYNRGLSYFHTHKYENAISDFTKAKEIAQDDDLKYYYWRCLAYQAIGDYNRAISDCARVIELVPSEKWAYGQRALLHWQKGDVNNVVADINESLRLDSEDSWNYYTLAMICYQQKKYGEALGNFARCEKLDKSQASYVTLCRYLCLFKLGRQQEGLNLLSKYLQNNKNEDWPNAIIKYLAGQINEEKLLTNSNNPDKFIDNGQKCEFFYYIGIKYWVDKNTNMAKTYFDKCLKTNGWSNYEHRMAQIELDELK